MNLNRRTFDPKRLIAIGMLFLVLALLAQHFTHPTALISPDLLDGLQGVLFGIAIGMNILAVWKLGKQNRSGAQH